MSSYSSLVLASTPLAYWRLRESSGTVATDETGANPGTYSSTYTQHVLAPGLARITQYAVGFTANLGKVAVAGSTLCDFDFGDPFTVECVLSQAASQYPPVYKHTGVFGWQFYFGNSNSIGYILKASNGHSMGGYAATLGLNDGWMHHVCASYDGSKLDTGIIVTVDGLVRTLNNQLANTIVGGDTMKNSASLSCGGMQGWAGNLAEVAIYNRVVPASELAAHFFNATDSFGALSQGASATVRRSSSRPAKDIVTVTPSGVALHGGVGAKLNPRIG